MTAQGTRSQWVPYAAHSAAAHVPPPKNNAIFHRFNNNKLTEYTFDVILFYGRAAVGWLFHVGATLALLVDYAPACSQN